MHQNKLENDWFERWVEFAIYSLDIISKLKVDFKPLIMEEIQEQEVSLKIS